MWIRLSTALYSRQSASDLSKSYYNTCGEKTDDRIMRFRFCGGLEPPDWLLAEIPLLATLEVARVSYVCTALAQDPEETDQLLRDSYASAQDAEAATAVLRFMLFQAAKYDVSDRELAVELLQLGVTSESAEAIASVYATERDAMRQRLDAQSFKFPTIEQLRWRVHESDPNEASAVKASRVEMRLQLDRDALLCERKHADGKSSPLGDSLAFTMTEDKFLALYEELAQAQAILQSLAR